MFFFSFVQDFSINGKQTIEFLDRDLEFLAGTGAGEGLDFYDIKDVIVDYQCTGYVVLSCISTYVLSSSYSRFRTSAQKLRICYENECRNYVQNK